MNPLAISLALMLLTNQSPALAPAVVAPPVEWYGFADTNHAAWPTDAWTNSWKVVALTSPDILLPISQWKSNAVVLQPHNGALCFSLPATDQRQFVRAIYIFEGAGP